MKGLLLKDFYNLRSTFKWMLLIIIIYSFLFLPTTPAGTFVFLSTLIMSEISLNAISYDQKSGWDSFVLVTPVNLKKLVLSRFVFMFIFTFIGLSIGLILSIIWTLINEMGTFNVVDIGEIILSGIYSFFYNTALGSVGIYLIQRFGFEKGRIIIFFFNVLPIVALVLLLKLLSNKIDYEMLINNSIYLFPVLSILFVCFLFYLSYRFLKAKDY